MNVMLRRVRPSILRARVQQLRGKRNSHRKHILLCSGKRRLNTCRLAKCWRGSTQECWRPGLASINVASGAASVDFESKSTAAPGVDELSQEAYAVQREEENQHWQPRKVLEGLDAGVLEAGASEHHYYASEGASVDFESKSTTAPGEEELSQEAHVVQRDEELLQNSSGNTINIGDTEFCTEGRH
ncbi:hypothetical protein CBR_g2652 [Chara braunii]|uniref:Uncharacterized protein n=1 Tax=Chara braunii TaxID=69332 RepID=A0A388KDG4_CHABU|nr:hypothetical protein CBR_g2652 [Chara braunii]|eukprot:GBG68102.1 hypothetical protein CBR_g2652 [Chara braunii]